MYNTTARGILTLTQSIFFLMILTKSIFIGKECQNQNTIYSIVGKKMKIIFGKQNFDEERSNCDEERSKKTRGKFPNPLEEGV